MIADRIKLLREKAGLSQTELSRLLSLSRSSVCAYESGLNVPSAQILVELSKILGVSVDSILCVEKTATINVSGLDDREIAILVDIANKFRENKQ
jgi:transcriptional regulator with XRE-family HTH domain